MLEGLPPIVAQRESVIEGHLAIAREFLTRARALVGTWPDDLERATLAHLAREFPEYAETIEQLWAARAADHRKPHEGTRPGRALRRKTSDPDRGSATLRPCSTSGTTSRR